MRYICPQCKNPTVEANYLGWRDCSSCGWKEELPTDLQEAKQLESGMYVASYSTGKIEVRLDKDASTVLEFHPEIGCVWHVSSPIFQVAAIAEVRAYYNELGREVDLSLLK